MERVAFLVEDTNERLRCLLNPETLVLQRTAGVRPRRSLGGPLAGLELSDDPLLFTGGGRTVLELDLLFDVTLAGSTIQGDDVRALTLPLWQMAENTTRRGGYGQPPQVRFIWGKAWNIPGVVEAVAERFERFTREGVAQRSWLRLRLVRVNDVLERPEPPPAYSLSDLPDTAGLAAPTEEWGAHEILGQPVSGDRLDQIAADKYGNPSLWRLLAAANGIDNPAEVESGSLLRIPPLSLLGGGG